MAQGQKITAEQAHRELTRRGRIGAGGKNGAISARERASAEGTLTQTTRDLAAIAGIDLSTVKSKRAAQTRSTNKKTALAEAAAPPSRSLADAAFTVRMPDPFTWQAEALAGWAAQGHRGVVEAVTGAGKTAVGLFAAAESLQNDDQVAIIVPTVALQEQWVASVRSAFPSAVIAQLGGAGGTAAKIGHAGVIVAVVDSVRKGLKVKRPGLLIADEVHRYGSKQNAGALNKSFPRRLGLTATFERPDQGIAEHLTPYFGKVCFRLGYRRAIADGVLAPFRVGLLPVELSTSEMDIYESLSRTMSGASHDLEEYIGFREPFAQFMKEIEILAEGGGQSMTWTARKYLKAMRDRRALLANTNARAEAFKRVVPLIKSSGQTLVFAERITQAGALADTLSGHGIEARTIHSGLRLDERRTLLRSFGNGTIKAVTAPRVLDEGIDVPEADLAVVVSATKTRRQMIQRMGRVIRRKADGREARFVLIYVRNTTEDPDRGAHDLFLDEVREAASELQIFPGGWNANDVVEWFSSQTLAVPAQNPSTKPRTTTIEQQIQSPAQAAPHESPGDDVVEELVRGYEESHQMVSKSELRDLRRQLPQWLREFRLSTLKAAVRRGSTVRDVGTTAGRIRAGIKAIQEPKPKKPELVRKPKASKPKAKKATQGATQRTLSGRKPNKRDKWIATQLGWDPVKVQDLRAHFPAGRDVGSRPETGTDPIARQLSIDRAELDQWLLTETRADTHFKKRSGSSGASAARTRPPSRQVGRSGATRSPQFLTCNACGTPVSPSGSCGCS
jgi:superfamily II DNA or RNA helicase